MIYYVGLMGRPQYEQCSESINQLGMILTPQSWRNPIGRYACDNGVYAEWTKGRVWGQRMHDDFMGMLSKIPTENPPEWVLLPDAVGDWARTVELAQIYLPIVRGLGYNVAVALQDGCEFDQVLDFDPQWVFVAGSTEWKECNIASSCEFFKPLGIRVHVGRVNTKRRLILCMSAGVDSCDGTTLNKFRDSTLPLVKHTLMQGCLHIR